MEHTGGQCPARTPASKGVQVTPSLAKMLVSPDPRGIAEKLLAYLMTILQAKGAAVLQYHNSRVLAFVSDSVDLDRLGEARFA